MFESVLERNVPSGPIALPAILAVGVHVAALAVALWIHARPAPVISRADVSAVKIFSRTIDLAQNGSAGAQALKSQPERTRSRTAIVESDKVRKHAETASVTATLDRSHATNEAASDSVSDGPASGVVGNANASGTTGAVGSAGSTITLPFGEGMTRPTAIAQPAPVYTREASATRSAGVVSARCTITVEGTLRDCRIVHGIPYMDTAVLEALSKWRYTPVTFQGRPVSVYYAINVRLVAP